MCETNIFQAWAADALAVTILELLAAVGKLQEGSEAGGRAKESSEAAFGWPKGTHQEPNRSHEEAKRSPRGAQEEAKKRQKGAHEEPRGGQEEPKRNPREGLWSPEVENTGPRARPTKTLVKNESRSV